MRFSARFPDVNYPCSVDGFMARHRPPTPRHPQERKSKQLTDIGSCQATFISLPGHNYDDVKLWIKSDRKGKILYCFTKSKSVESTFLFIGCFDQL